MSIFEKNPLAVYLSPPTNYIGSALFLSYIVAALFLTSTIGYSLYTQYISTFHSRPSSPPSKFKQNSAGQVSTRNARARHIKIYTGLALISFTNISWHMLGFLITSFLDWNSAPTRDVLTALNPNALDKLKTWMLQTGLFNSFAMQLVADPESALWTQLSILATWGWNLWLGNKARQYNFTTNTMLPFIFLGQNLPISFAMALFIIQLHLSAPDGQGSKNERQQNPQSKRAPLASSLLPTIIFNAMLLATPTLRSHPGFSYLVLAERLLLFLPHTGLLKLSDADMQKSAAVSGGFVAANWAMMRKGLITKDFFTALLWKGQAVKTMAWDAVLSAVVYGALSWGGGV
ncbi:hypothetical protein G6514_001088 [Epicoccum nigrum]|nr:hypothetical protein G6514_001088 [Epicoccum nigrum]